MAQNRFDEKAATWDDKPIRIERAETVAQAVRAAIALDPSMHLLEYGAGTGLVTQALRDDLGPVTLADSSQGMLEVLRSKVAAGTIEDARVWDLDLVRDEAPDERFDLIVTAMALHHVSDLEAVLDGFAELLEPGGHLCAVDLEQEDGSFHTGEFDGHHGFNREELTAALREAGFDDIRFEPCYEIIKNDRPYGVFFLVCTRVEATRKHG